MSKPEPSRRKGFDPSRPWRDLGCAIVEEAIRRRLRSPAPLATEDGPVVPVTDELLSPLLRDWR